MGNTGACQHVQRSCTEKGGNIQQIMNELSFPRSGPSDALTPRGTGTAQSVLDGAAPQPAMPLSSRHARESPKRGADSIADCDRMTVQTESTAASSTASSHKGQEGGGASAQKVVKEFVRAFVKGRKISVLTANGGVAECFATLDRKLTTFSIQRTGTKNSKKREIPLEQVAEISVGNEAEEELGLPLDDLCTTLLLEDGQGIAFRFEDVESRDTFALCFSMFVDARRGEQAQMKAEGRR